MADEFVHLHTHTEHSLLDGANRIADLVEKVGQDGAEAVAITDHGSLAGALRLDAATRGTGIKPILGEEIYLAIGSRHSRIAVDVPGEVDAMSADADPAAGAGKTKRRVYEHLTLLAATPTGWSNLVRIQNAAERAYWYKPRTDLELLAEHPQGLIAMTGCLAGPVAGPLARGDRPEADRGLRRLVDTFGRENVYVEIMDHGIGAERAVLEPLIELARAHGVGVVATNDSHHTHAADARAHDALLCLQAGSVLSAEKRFRFNGSGYHLRSAAEMYAVRNESWWRDAVATSVEIAGRIAPDVLGPANLRLPTFPSLPAEYGGDSAAYLRDLVLAGALERYGEDPNRPGRPPAHVGERLRTEFGVFERMGMIDYCLIVWEMVAWARSKGILVGPGRGSGPGSAVLYCLGVTQIEPLGAGLLFERFLDPDRDGMPDVDTDFERGRRHEVVEHLVDLYGEEMVARIGTRGVMRTKAAIKDAARVLELSTVGARLADLVPLHGAAPMTLGQLDEVTEETAAFHAAVQASGQDAREILDIARTLEGVTRAESIHPCGVLISNEPMTGLVPMRYERADGEIAQGATRIAAWDGPDLERRGFLKLDALGLRNLDVVALAVQYIEQTSGERLDIETIEPDGGPRDCVTWAMLGEGRTAGTFQLESEGMAELARQVAPETMEDLTALVALYRPGPMAAGMHTRYADRKNGREPVSYAYLTNDPAEAEVIAGVLDVTYASVVYQEQLQMLGLHVAGLDASWRNQLRRAFSKKKADLMAKVREVFFDGGRRGAGPAGVRFSEATLENLWVTFEGSGQYLFNKCITGDTVLTNGKGIEWTVRDLYQRLHGEDASGGLCPRCRERSSRLKTPTCARCMSWRYMFDDPDRGFCLMALDSADGRLRPQRVKDVHHQGHAMVHRVALDDGTVLRATEDHRFMGSDGQWVRVGKMEPGVTKLVIDGGYEPQRFKEADRTTSGERRGAPGKPWRPGESNCGFVDGGFMKFSQWKAATRRTASCRECGRTEGRLEAAHLDGNRLHNDVENLAWMCPSDHKAYDYRVNGRPRRWSKGHLAATRLVVSVEPDGVEEVFDVEMADGTDHNFTANGVVSHNSHSAAYGRLAYVTAYLSANWPVEYGAAILATTASDTKRAAAIRSLRGQGIDVVAPDVNGSMSRSAPVSGRVAIGLREVKGVSAAAADAIVADRDRFGPYRGVGDLLRRVTWPHPKTGKLAVPSSTDIDALIEAGGFDGFGPRLGQRIAVRAAARFDPAVPDAEWGILERASRQRGRLGFVVGEHPLAVRGRDVAAELDRTGRGRTALRRVDEAPDRARLWVVAMLAAWAEKPYSRGMRANVVLEASDGRQWDAVVWDDALRAVKERGQVPDVGQVVRVGLRVRRRTVVTEVVDEADGSISYAQTHTLNLSIDGIEAVELDDVTDWGMPTPAAGIRAEAAA